MFGICGRYCYSTKNLTGIARCIFTCRAKCRASGARNKLKEGELFVMDQKEIAKGRKLKVTPAKGEIYNFELFVIYLFSNRNRQKLINEWKLMYEFKNVINSNLLSRGTKLKI